MNEQQKPGGIRPGLELDSAIQDRVMALSLWIDGIKVEKRADAYQELNRIAEAHSKEHEGLTVGQVPGVAEARRLYRSFGIDPTSTRPSSEALLKRSLKGSELYHLNNVVDIGNAVSLATLLPLGLYDRDTILGDLVVVREGREGEEFTGIRKGPVHLSRRLCVADDQGAFGSPTSDSFRTRITEETVAILVIVFAPADGEAARLELAGDRLEAGFTQFAGGTTVKRQMSR